jgi:hypothetical protein
LALKTQTQDPQISTFTSSPWIAFKASWISGFGTDGLGLGFSACVELRAVDEGGLPKEDDLFKLFSTIV